MSKAIPYVLLLAAMTGLYAMSLPHLDVDRMQENVYLGVPYAQVQSGHLYVKRIDPFAEMGPHAVYIPAWIAYQTRSLLPVRAYQWGYVLLSAALLLLFFRRHFSALTQSTLQMTAYAAIMLAVWYSIPLALIYPTQVNGMTAGFSCVIAAMLLIERHPYAAMLALGFAYTFKGQFLALYPGLVAYLLFADVRHQSVVRQSLHILTCALLFFVPSVVILPLAAYAIGMFQSAQDAWAYAWQGPAIIYEEASHVFRRLLGSAVEGDLDSVRRAAGARRVEHSGYGSVTWAHMAISFGFCLAGTAYGFWQRIQMRIGRASELPGRPWVLFAFMGSFYWFNFLFVYRYPYWYNVFAVILFNMVLVASGVALVSEFIRRRYSLRAAQALVIVILLLCTGFVGNRWSQTYWRLRDKTGSSLALYDWMRASGSPDDAAR